MNACASGVCSSYTALGSTITLANAPALPSTFSNVSPVGLRVSFGAGNNPTGTSYTVQISTSPTFIPDSELQYHRAHASQLHRAGAEHNLLPAGAGDQLRWNIFCIHKLRIDGDRSRGAASQRSARTGGILVGVDQHGDRRLESFDRSDELHLSRFDNFNESSDKRCRVQQHGAQHRDGFRTDSKHDLFPVRERLRVRSMLELHGSGLHHHPGQCAGIVRYSTFSSVSPVSLTVSFGANNNPAGTRYTVQISTNPAFSLILNSSITTLTQATFTGLAPNTTYYLQAQAISFAGTPSAFTNLGSTVTVTVSAPTVGSNGGILAASTSTITAAWNLSIGATGYTLVASTTSANPPTLIAASSSTALSTATVSGLVPNTTYFLFVNACASGACSTYTALGSTITLANAPALPSTFSNLSPVSLTVSFGANNNPTGTSYTVQISSNPTFGPILNSSITVLTQATFTGLAPNTTYYLQAFATNFAGTSSAFTTLGSTITATLSPPTIGSSGGILAASTSTVMAAWNLSTGATGYTLVASTTSTNPPTVITASSSTALSTATVSGLIPNTTYFLFVNACAAGACSSYSAVGSTITLANAPALPSTFSNVSPVGLTISFSANGNPTGTSYTVQISTNPTFSPIVNSSITLLTQATFTGLASNMTYYLQALATNFAGTPSAFTNLGSTVTAAVLPPTVGSSGGILAASTSTITTAWNLSTGATSYTLVASTISTNPPTLIVASSSTALSIATVSGPRSKYDLLPVRERLRVGRLLKLHRAGFYHHVSQCAGTAQYLQCCKPCQLEGQLRGWQQSSGNNLHRTDFHKSNLYSDPKLKHHRAHAGQFHRPRAEHDLLPAGVGNQLCRNAVGLHEPGVDDDGHCGASHGWNGGVLATSTSTITAVWNLSAGATSYTLVASTTSVNPPTSIAASSSTALSTATVSGLIPNTTYFLFVNACASGACSSYTALGSTITLANAPALPGTFSNVSPVSLTVNFGANNNPAGTSYTVQISTNPTFIPILNSSITLLTQATFTGLASRTTYYLQAQAISFSGTPSAFTNLRIDGDRGCDAAHRRR